MIYIVKENRTYDQVLGDLEKGNGDPSLAILGPYSPNHHELARRFVTLDHFFDSGEVSRDGWNWRTAARATDFTEKTVAVNYGGRGLSYDWEGTNRNINVGLASLIERKAANPYQSNDADPLPGASDVEAPDSPEGEAGAGYLWDSARRNITELPRPDKPRQIAASRTEAQPQRDAAYWARAMRGQDFTAEDRLDETAFNRALWTGLKGENVAYPSAPHGRDLSKGRRGLLVKTKADESRDLKVSVRLP